MNTFLFPLGGFFMLTAVILGAFGAHGLEGSLSPEQLETYKTGVTYQFYHALALLFLGLYSQHNPSKLLKWAGILFSVGIFLFSGSIYLLACKDLLGIASWKWLGPITPIGGTLFIIGWGLFLGAVHFRNA